MYRIIKENEVVAVVDKLHFCRPQANDIPCLTDEANAHGIVIDDAFFHIEGFPEWEGKETVKYEEFAGTAAIATAQAELAEARSEVSEILIAAREGLVSPPLARCAVERPNALHYRRYRGGRVCGAEIQPWQRPRRHGQYRRLLGDTAGQLSGVDRY